MNIYMCVCVSIRINIYIYIYNIVCSGPESIKVEGRLAQECLGCVVP